MKPEVLILAIILLLVGFISAAISQMGAENWKETQLEIKENTNEVSAPFSKGEKMYVKFEMSDQWRSIPLLSEPDIPYPAMYLYFNITGPVNDVTRFIVTLVRLTNDSLPLIYGVELTQNGSLTVSVNPQQSTQTSEVGGTVNYGGLYTASVYVIPPLASLPKSLGLYKKTLQISHPYTLLFSIGVLISIFGFALVILWVMKYTPPQRRTRKRKRKTVR